MNESNHQLIQELTHLKKAQPSVGPNVLSFHMGVPWYSNSNNNKHKGYLVPWYSNSNNNKHKGYLRPPF